MSVRSFFTGVREFWTPDQIINWLREKWELDAGVFAKPKLFFETSKQHTWLIATPDKLACVLDDTREPKPAIRWEMQKQQVVEDNKIKLPLSHRDQSDWTGVIDFGTQHRNWLFSRKLFANESVENDIESFIKMAMVND